MRTDQIEFLSQLGQSFWPDHEIQKRTVNGTLAAVACLDLEDDEAFERSAVAFLDRARKANLSHSTASIHQPFYRLNPLQRFVLTCLHFRKWKYAEIARLGKTTAEEVEKQAWAARTEIGAWFGLCGLGSANQSPNCPDYHLDRPWTQRYLDEQLSKKEAHWLRSHIEGCRHCRVALESCRAIYARTGSFLPPKQEVKDLPLFYEKMKRKNFRWLPRRIPKDLLIVIAVTALLLLIF